MGVVMRPCQPPLDVDAKNQAAHSRLIEQIECQRCPLKAKGSGGRRLEQIEELLMGQSCIASNETHGDGSDRVMPWNY